MSEPLLLIVSSKLSSEAFLGSPFFLQPEEFVATNYESLGFMGLSRFQAVILHDPDPDISTKLSMGIRDERLLESLWELVNSNPNSLRILVSAPCRPSKSWFDLGVETVTPPDLRTCLTEPLKQREISRSLSERQNVLTADDIRELHRKGQINLNSETAMTDWAREVATALGMTIMANPPRFTLLQLPSQTRASLEKLSEEIYSISNTFLDLLFVVNTPLLPVFKNLFPSIAPRLVASTLHWADSGAFTGEVSLSMLLDAGCKGAIIPNHMPYIQKEHISKIAEKAANRGFLLFIPNPLELVPEYDIMPQHKGLPFNILKVIDFRNSERLPQKKDESIFISWADVKKGFLTGVK